MALGDATKAQKIIARNRGWDPDVIQGTGENIGWIEPAAETHTNETNHVGRLKEEIPGGQGMFPQATESALSESLPWQAPDLKARIAGNNQEGVPGSSNPYPGTMEG